MIVWEDYTTSDVYLLVSFANGFEVEGDVVCRGWFVNLECLDVSTYSGLGEVKRTGERDGHTRKTRAASVTDMINGFLNFFLPDFGLVWRMEDEAENCLAGIA